MISDLADHSLLEMVRCAFYAGPNQASRSWKDWSARAGGRHFPILRLSRCCGLFCPFVLVMSFGRRWERSCLLWWLFKFTTKILNITSNSCQATLPRCFPPSVQLDRLDKKKNGTNNSPGAILIPDAFQEPSIDNLSPDQSLVFFSWTLIENGFWHLCSHMDQTPEILQEL